MEVEWLEEYDGLFTLIAHDVTRKNIGRISVRYDGEDAHIIDITIDEKEYIPYKLLPFIKRKLSYQGKGYGSKLLELAIERCRQLGVKNITG